VLGAKPPNSTVCSALLAELAVTTMADHIRGKKVEPRIATGEALATPENMHTPEIQKLLKPEMEE